MWTCNESEPPELGPGIQIRETAQPSQTGPLMGHGMHSCGQSAAHRVRSAITPRPPNHSVPVMTGKHHPKYSHPISRMLFAVLRPNSFNELAPGQGFEP